MACVEWCVLWLAHGWAWGGRMMLRRFLYTANFHFPHVIMLFLSLLVPFFNPKGKQLCILYLYTSLSTSPATALNLLHPFPGAIIILTLTHTFRQLYWYVLSHGITSPPSAHYTRLLFQIKAETEQYSPYNVPSRPSCTSVCLLRFILAD